MNSWPKVPTGIDGFDDIADGGPAGSITLVTGTLGTPSYAFGEEKSRLDDLIGV